jgi:hypothetical protein
MITGGAVLEFLYCVVIVMFVVLGVYSLMSFTLMGVALGIAAILCALWLAVTP